MSRQLHTAHNQYPYHVTARSHDGVWFHLPLKVVWSIMSDYLYLIVKMYEVRVHSFVLMNNHFHLLVSTPNANLSHAMNYFMRETSKEINRLSGKTNQVYGNRYFRSLITDDLHFAHVYKYVYRNPVSAGVLEKCEDYKFSTLNGLLGQQRLFIPLAEDQILFELGKFEHVISWLNQEPRQANYLTLKRSLKRRILKFADVKWSTHIHTLHVHRF